MRYPGPDGMFATPDDVTTINQLHIPLGQPVLIHLRSKDVIHSFFVPLMRFKQDAVPGLPGCVISYGIAPYFTTLSSDGPFSPPCWRKK